MFPLPHVLHRWTSAWRAFARSTRSTWRGPTPTSPPLPMTSASSSISSIRSSARCVIEALSESSQIESVALTKSDRWQMVSFDDEKDKGYQAISAPHIHLGRSLKIKYQWCPIQLADLSCLVYQKSTNTYAPYNKVTIYCSRILKITLSRFTQQTWCNPSGLDQGEDLHPAAATGQQGQLEPISWTWPFNVLNHEAPIDVLYIWW